jgi:RHS repeat-associated protein
MRFINTDKTWFAALVVMAVAAVPLHASIPRTIEISSRGTATLRSCETLGRTASFTNAEGRVYRMGYDAQGRLLAATNAAGEQVVRNLYDYAGNLTNRVDAASRLTVYRYDALNRGTNTVYADGSYEAFTYDGAGNLLAAGNGAATNSFAYDAMNRLTSAVTRVSGLAFAVKYGHDLGGLATNVVYPDGKAVRTAYDADGRVASVTDWAGRTWTFARDAAGRLTSLAYPNGVSGAYTYDANHAVESWSFNNGTPFTGRTVTRDAAGIKTEEHVTAGLFPNPQSPRRAQNTFDAADRLVSATVAVGTNAYAETYRCDGCGSLTNVTRGAETQDYEYDLAGRLTFAAVSGATLSVTYDALGNRLTTYAVNATRLWATDHADSLKRPLMEADSNGNPLRWYVWGGGMLLAVVEADGVVRYAHSDEQGSVIALTDSSGALTDQYCYGPYGNDWGHTGTNNIPFRWLGSHGVFNVGGSALHLTRYRAYDTYTGRFLSSDPLGLGGGPNLYSYCLGNPLSYIDPQGLGAEAGGEWVIGPDENPWLVFNKDSWEDLHNGAYAALDGVVPFADPFEDQYADENGRIDPLFLTSQNIAAFSRDILIAAAIPNLSTWVQNPILYEIGQTTTSPVALNAMRWYGFNAIQKGQYLVNAANGSYINAAFSTVWSQAGNTILTGLTPGGYLLILGGGEAVDYQMRK